MESSDDRPAILVVEDDDAIRGALQSLFTDEGYVVRLAANGTTALSALSTQRPDLVTLDLNLPDVSGVEVLRTIRQTVTLQTIKVVIISASLFLPPELQELADAAVAKPFDVAALLAIVAALLLPPTVL